MNILLPIVSFVYLATIEYGNYSRLLISLSTVIN